MTGLIIFFHSIVCVGLVTIILMQAGRGGGLTEAFSSAESVFGAKTNEFLIKGTTIFAALFLVTCVSLAIISAKRKASIMPDQLATQSEKDAEKVVQDIIDQAKKNTVTLDTPAATEQAAPEVPAVETAVPAGEPQAAAPAAVEEPAVSK
jgi:protein translocase SecG subunit